MKEPEKSNIVIFRENTEDVYAGIEWRPDRRSETLVNSHDRLRQRFARIRDRHQADVGVRLEATRSRWQSDMPLRRCRESVTLVHKGNIMKFTEGAFRDWGYELAKKISGHRVLNPTRERPVGSSRRRRDHQGPHRRLDVPAAVAAAASTP
jgi:isocitrate dehydrogenase